MNVITEAVPVYRVGDEVGLHLKALWLMGLGFCVSAPLHAQAGERVALLIGNAAYEEARLLKPAQDVVLMEGSLKRLDFKVTKLLDADQKQIQRAFRDFGQAAANAEVAFFYYSGHGLQSSGENFLVPLHAQIAKDSDISIEAVPINGLLRQLEEARPKYSVVVLDACRDNPWLRSKGSGTKGLVRMDSPGGTLVAFATSPNATAADEGLYARYLSQYLLEPGLELRKVFDRVGGRIDRETNGRQRPRTDNGIYEDIFLTRSRINNQDSSSSDAFSGEENHAWEDTKKINTAGAYQAYLKAYPNGKWKDWARAALDKLLDEQRNTRIMAGADRRPLVSSTLSSLESMNRLGLKRKLNPKAIVFGDDGAMFNGKYHCCGNDDPGEATPFDVLIPGGFSKKSFSLAVDVFPELKAGHILSMGTSYRWLSLYRKDGFIQIHLNNHRKVMDTEIKVPEGAWSSLKVVFDESQKRLALEAHGKTQYFTLAESDLPLGKGSESLADKDNVLSVYDYSNGSAYKGGLRNIEVISPL